MNLCIQDPSYANSMYLQEALLSECEKCISGAGAYAFASKDGIELFLEDESFKKMIVNGTFVLIVGMDDITNMRSLQTLKAISDRYKGKLIVKAYVHNNQGSTFHPKFSWFQNNQGGTLVIGSGNLTLQGLRHNREAFAIIKYDKEDFDQVVQDWDNWFNHSKPFLFDVDDPVVLSVAERNAEKTDAVNKAKKEAIKSGKKTSQEELKKIFAAQPIDKKQSPKTGTPKTGATTAQTTVIEYKDDDEKDYWVITPNTPVLVAEIPKSGSRWKQVNFNKDTFEKYFGATCGENGAYRILLKSISKDGVLGEIEVRPSVSVSSQNYRFELNAASGIDYPNNGERPLCVFAKVAQRDFIYELVMPGENGYLTLKGELDKREITPNRMRRLTYYCKEISKNTPELAIWKCIGK